MGNSPWLYIHPCIERGLLLTNRLGWKFPTQRGWEERRKKTMLFFLHFQKKFAKALYFQCNVMMFSPLDIKLMDFIYMWWFLLLVIGAGSFSFVLVGDTLLVPLIIVLALRWAVVNTLGRILTSFSVSLQCMIALLISSGQRSWG